MWWTLAALLACGEKDEAAAPTWYGDVRGVVESECASCHFEGGNTPFALETYEQAAAYAPMMAAAVEAGTMPPWMPSDDCRSYEGARVLSDDEIATLRAWADGGAPEGEDDGSASQIRTPVTLDDATDELQIPAYTPALGADDDYRCFVLDVAFDATRYVTGAEIVPGTSPVHHVLVYALTADDAPAVAAADGADGLPGYPCVGSPYPPSDAPASPSPLGGLPEGFGSGNGFPNQLAGWAPGGGAVLLPDGLATAVSPGSVVVAQVHYSTLGGEPEVDDTLIRLRITDEEPEQLLVTSALINYELDIPAGASSVVVSDDTPYYGFSDLTLRSVAGHMHVFGTRITGATTSPEGDETCLLDIPDWDFHWQGGYLLTDQEVIPPGSRLRLTCEYDNSQANQPVVDGEAITPADLTWGEDTLDEMCLMYLSRVEPFVAPLAPGEPPCARVADCVDACAPDDLDCRNACIGPDDTCSSCVSESISTCAPQCTLVLFADLECATDCILGTALLGGNTRACLQAECPDTAQALDDCLIPAGADDACVEAYDACGL